MATMGQRTKKIRQELNLSQEQLGAQVGSGRAYISLVETDRSKMSLENIVKLSLTYNINLNYWLNGVGDIFNNVCENSHVFIENDSPEKDIQNWGTRLTQILTENNETPRSFAKRVGISESRIENFILNSSEPTVEELTNIKKKVDISIDWLLYGETVTSKTKTQANNSLSQEEILKLKALLKKV